MSLALNAPQNADGSLTLIQPSSLIPPVNASGATDDSTIEDMLRLKATTLKDPQIECDGRRFGNPQVVSCKDVVAYMLHQQNPATLLRDPTLSYGPRGQGAWDVKLPKRYISTDGQCIIDLTQTSFPSHVKLMSTLSAAHVIQDQCVEKDTPPWGGIAHGMAVEKNFQVTMQAYRPPFTRCSNTPPAARPVTTACQTIIDTMNAATDQTTFGARNVEDVQQHLPMVLTEPTNTCAISIDITAPDDKASWYDLWQAAVALDGLCARVGRTGKARFLGANRKLTMEMKRS